ncbi:MAG: right-handed parallel beta-helix repeat-containing protein, partial [Phycisphaerae bacterium]|nr:right-handed parallel beta-helix repeat-containing protein [Phycisphaerae bacterium]
YFTGDPDGLHHHISFRHLESYGIPPSFGTAVGVSRGHHIVIYDNHIHHNGDPEWPDENDLHGVTALAQAEYAWIVDNHIHHNGGDSIQINSVNAPPDLVAQYIYIGRNVMHDDGENAVDLKLCRDVIVSQNEMYGYVPSHFATSGSDGTAMVIHGDPIDVWVIHNHIYDSTNGVRCNGAVRAFILGNLIHNMHHDPIDPYDPGNVWSSGAGVITWATPELHVAGNTIYDVDSGFSSPGGGTQAHHVYNNIIANLAEPAHHIGVAGSGVAAASTMHHNVLYNPGGSARIKWSSTSPVYNLAQFQATFPGQGLGCTEADPLLADPANGDLHITQGSPAVSAASEPDFTWYTDLFFSLYGVSITVDYDGVPRPHDGGLDMGAYELMSTVVGRYVFYNSSAFDGNNPAANAADDAAIATDKTALLAGGTATFANYTSYASGINGIMIDIPSLPGTPSASDFEFKVGNDNMPGGWSAVGVTPTITIRSGAGAGGSDRITIIWTDNAIAKQWLQVTVLATVNTGLGLPDVFYFGNAIGETGNSPTDAEVTPADQVGVRDHPHTLGVNPADVTDAYDFNRDRKVGPTDQIICRNNGTSGPTALKLITVP